MTTEQKQGMPLDEVAKIYGTASASNYAATPVILRPRLQLSSTRPSPPLGTGKIIRRLQLGATFPSIRCFNYI